MNKVIKSFAAGLLSALFSIICFAQEDPGYYAELKLQLRQPKDGGANQFVKELYAEKEVGGVIPYVILYDEPGFRSTVAGISKKFGDVQVGIGAGKAKYDDVRRTLVSGFVYYSADPYEALISYERYRGETIDPYFTKGYLMKSVNDRWSVGAYGETFSGIGPALGYKIGKDTNLTLAHFPNAGELGVKWMLFFTVGL